MIDQRHTIRYSPLPIEGYSVKLGKASYGPAGSRLLQRPGAWNLAYLSHDYLGAAQPPDPHFTTHVFYTIKFDWVSKALDLGDAAPFEHTVASKLQMPAPQFVKWLLDHPDIVVELPLHKAYGPAWLETVTKRSFGCHDYDYELDLAVRDISAASVLLQRYRTH